MFGHSPLGPFLGSISTLVEGEHACLGHFLGLIMVMGYLFQFEFCYFLSFVISVFV